ncbi:hypothetical protein [Streptomyces sp. AA1529]|uniref:hypothetical protein n=1 Tax=Streptomyces sp. AA1529 TaxID=1203257 RepID=UPI0002ECE04F|nr:hypothetical protein [Streptomyces sp. AA1529]
MNQHPNLPDRCRAVDVPGIEVHRPIPVESSPPPAPLAVPLPPHAGTPAVQSVQLPDGRIVTGYALATPQEPTRAAPAVNRTAINLALGGIGFAAVCGGLVLLTGFIAALAAFVHQLIILAAVIFGGWVAVQGLGSGSGRTTVNIRKAVIKRNHFHG